MKYIDLHRHLDGSVRPATLLDLSRTSGIPLPADNADELLPFVQAPADCPDLSEYLKRFELILPLMQTPDALERIARECVEDCAREGLIYGEIRFAPQFHRKEGLTPAQATDHILRGLRAGEQSCGLKLGLILTCMRHHPFEKNEEIIRTAEKYLGRGVVGVDLAGQEEAYPARLFYDVFARAAAAEIPVTIHAGEAAGPENIEHAVKRLGARRIGHGIRLKQDRSVFEFIRDRNIPLEMCPLSNIQTKAVSSWEDYPFLDYYRNGINITVNTDNPLISNTNMSREFGILKEKFGISDGDVRALTENALEAAFISDDEKKALLQKLNETE